MQRSRRAFRARRLATRAVSPVILAAFCAGANAQQANSPTTPGAAEARVDALLKQMTLEEKIDMLGGTGFGTKPLPRLKIPALQMTDGPMGARIPPPSTAFAAGIGLAASWDPALAERVGQQIARDARSRGAHFLLGPGVNIYRSPLNGRNFEYFGEDPFLGARIAVGYINGVQSERVSATIKHYMGNNSEFARNTSNTVIDERTMREIYLPIFETAVKDAHVGAIMDSYNLTNGLYMTQNPYFNTDVAKTQWGFDGIIMSDWGATHDALGAANGGMDLEMPSGQFLNRKTLLPAVQQGTVSAATIDDKVRRILRLAVRFGWLDREQLDRSIPRYNQPGREVARDGARESMVLLKNANGLLPLDKRTVKKIAVIGPDAFPAIPTAGGSGNVPPFSSVSILTGISDALGTKGTVTYARGIPTLAQMVRATRFTVEPNGKRGLTVETFTNADASGAPASTHIERTASIGRSFFDSPGEMDFGPDDFAGLGTPPKPTSMRLTGYFTPQTAGTHVLFVQSMDN